MKGCVLVSLRKLRGVSPERWGSLVCVLALAGLVVGLFWPAATVRGVFFVGDIYRLGYPARYEYALALRQGRVPLWTPHSLAGYPVLAEGQTGAYYPLNLLLYRLLPLPAALNYSVLLALWMAGAGMFLYVRSLGLRRGPAFLAACTFMLGGFLPGHLNHLNMLAAASLLPLLLWAAERATSQGRWRGWALVGGLFGLQGLAGHPQISLLSGLLVVGYAGVGPLAGGPGGLRRRAGQVAWSVAALTFGAALAGVQWLPTYELTRLSQRGQGLDVEFFTSFSLHPLRFATMLWPFMEGNPYPLVSLETIGYVGALPLLLVAAALPRRRNRVVLAWTAVAAVAFLLCLGRWNPAYRYLIHVPVFNMFRAPARYLLWLDLAIAILAAVGMDRLLALTRPTLSGGERWPWLAGGLALALGAALWLTRLPLEQLVSCWRFLPLVWLAGGGALIAALLWRPPARAWAALAVALLVADLYAFNGVYNQTYNATMSPAELSRIPASLDFLQREAGDQPYRVYTSEEIVPVLPVMRESLYPNIQALHQVDSLNGYYPLLPEPQRWLLENLNPRLLDLVNVRYLLIPQVLPVDAASEAYDTNDPFAPSIVGRSFDLPDVRVAALEVEGYLSHSADLTTGTPVCTITVQGDAGAEATWTLRAGVELAEWAYKRDDVEEVIGHDLPPAIVRSWPAQSGFPPREHVGLAFGAEYSLPRETLARRISFQPLIPGAFVHIERVRLVGPEGERQLLSAVAGEGDHVLVCRSSDVAIFRNEEAGPRAFLVHRTRVAQSEEEARELVAAPGFEPWREAVLMGGSQMDGEPLPEDDVAVEVHEPEYVRVRVRTARAGYLVLADSYYPGWQARVEGQRAAVERADVALRAVAVPPGEHIVEFRYAPTSWRVGAAVSGAAWVLLLGAAALRLTRRRVGRR